MNKNIVLGIIPVADAETAINNLSEADYDEKDISLVMRDVKTARLIIDDYGPLNNTNPSNIGAKLTELGVSKDSQKSYSEALENGKALLAISCTKENVNTTKSMLADYKTTNVIVI